MAKDKVVWKKAGSELTRRNVLQLVYGDTDTGRTTYALTAPGPIALIHAAEKIEGVTQPFVREGKDIRVVDFGSTFRGKEEEIAHQANEVWRSVNDAIDDAYGWARTIIIDTATELWELLRLARFGKVSQVKPIHYGPVNAEWRSLFKQWKKQGDTNMVVIAQTREKYRNDKPTGVMEQAGQKEMPYLCDVVVRMDREMNGTFTATIEKAWWNSPMRGMVLENRDARFGFVMSLVSELDENEWS